jgi:hypothetical protein
MLDISLGGLGILFVFLGMLGTLENSGTMTLVGTRTLVTTLVGTRTLGRSLVAWGALAESGTQEGMGVMTLIKSRPLIETLEGSGTLVGMLSKSWTPEVVSWTLGETLQESPTLNRTGVVFVTLEGTTRDELIELWTLDLS